MKSKYNIGDVFTPLKPKEWTSEYQKFEIHAIRSKNN